MSEEPQAEVETATRRPEPVLPDHVAPARHLTLDDLWLECGIDAALIDMHLPPAIKRDTVLLAKQSIQSWRDQAGEMRKVEPAVVLWGLRAQDLSGTWYRGSLVGVEGGAQIDAVAEGISVLWLFNRNLGGWVNTTDDLGFALWRTAAAPLEDGVRLRGKFDPANAEAPESISAWLRDKVANDPQFDTANLHLGDRDLPHVATVGLYRVQSESGDFWMEQVGPVVRSVSKGYTALPLGSMRHPWRGQHGEGTRLVFAGARRRRLKTALETPVANPAYLLPGLSGDPATVVADADADYAKRHQSDIWRDFLPPPNEAKAIAEAQAFVAYINATLRDLHIRHECAEPELAGSPPRDLPYTARIRDLPFWDCYKLVEITERLGARSRRTSLLWAKDPDSLPTSEASQHTHPDVAMQLQHFAPHVGQVIGLDGTSEFINLINQLLALVGRLKINAETARSYVEFFCAQVHGEEGSFSILEHPDDVDWTGFHHQQRELIGPCLFPMRLWPDYGAPGEGHEEVEDSDFVIESTLTYGGGLFRSIFLARPDGHMAMLADNLIVKGLQIRAYRFTQKNNWLLATFPEVK
jgi:hypothetical protein